MELDEACALLQKNIGSPWPNSATSRRSACRSERPFPVPLVSTSGRTIELPPLRVSWDWIVPHGLWETAKYAIPEHQTRRQGGGTANRCDETLFAAILYVLVSGCAWRSLPPCFGVSKSTVHRRFLIWTKADVWRKLHDALLQRREEKGLIAFSRRILDSAHARTEKGVNVEIREAWTGAERIPGCMSCRTRPDCAWSSVSQPPAHS
ncbi:transposase [Streptomyces sp. NPDC001027]|uniref:transposase n=1 Tax=Streptomyces sp. NPDC001027 TaxID=3154771 RepID=UPI0033305357